MVIRNTIIDFENQYDDLWKKLSFFTVEDKIRR